MTYEEQLQTPEWRSKREEILMRDMYMCQSCMSGHNLQVHHKKYIPGRMAWEYFTLWEKSHLITLCRKCHAAEHGIEYIEKGDYKLSKNQPYLGGSYDSRAVKSISQVMRECLLRLLNG